MQVFPSARCEFTTPTESARKRIWHITCGREDVDDFMTWIVQHADLGPHGDFLMQGDWHMAQAMGSYVIISQVPSYHLPSRASEPVGWWQKQVQVLEMEWRR